MADADASRPDVLVTYPVVIAARFPSARRAEDVQKRLMRWSQEKHREDTLISSRFRLLDQEIVAAVFGAHTALARPVRRRLEQAGATFVELPEKVDAQLREDFVGVFSRPGKRGSLTTSIGAKWIGEGDPPDPRAN
jgi:hypothetical protein